MEPAYLPRFGVDAEGCLEQMVHLLRDLHIQAGVGKCEEHLLPGPQQLLLAPSVSALGVQDLQEGQRIPSNPQCLELSQHAQHDIGPRQ